MDDDGEHLDLETCRDWAQLFTAFTAEWMDLEGFMGTQQKAGLQEHSGRAKRDGKDEL